jgi:hypothetical protein
MAARTALPPLEVVRMSHMHAMHVTAALMVTIGAMWQALDLATGRPAVLLLSTGWNCQLSTH